MTGTGATRDPISASGVLISSFRKSYIFRRREAGQEIEYNKAARLV